MSSNISEKININNDALIHANSLKNNSLQKRQLKEIITDIIRRISQELIVAHREGKHSIMTNIPITFTIPNMSNKDSQRVVWSNIIDELKSKSYRIWISPSKNTCNVKITWMSPDDENEIKTQMKLIIKHTKRF
jgi:hypothetical protein